MANFIHSAAERIRRSGAILPIYLAAWAAFLGLIVLFLSDLATTYLGYAAWPTDKPLGIEAYAVAVLPQCLGLLTLYAFMTDTRKNLWGLIVGVGLMATDAVFDVWFKASTSGAWGLAIFETIAIYSLGSELALPFVFGQIWELSPDAGALVKGALVSIGLWPEAQGGGQPNNTHQMSKAERRKFQQLYDQAGRNPRTVAESHGYGRQVRDWEDDRRE